MSRMKYVEHVTECSPGANENYYFQRPLVYKTILYVACLHPTTKINKYTISYPESLFLPILSPICDMYKAISILPTLTLEFFQRTERDAFQTRKQSNGVQKKLEQTIFTLCHTN